MFYEKPCFLLTHVKKGLGEFWENISKKPLMLYGHRIFKHRGNLSNGRENRSLHRSMCSFIRQIFTFVICTILYQAHLLQNQGPLLKLETLLFGQQLVLKYFIFQRIVHVINNLKQLVMVHCAAQLCGLCTTGKMKILINNQIITITTTNEYQQLNGDLQKQWKKFPCTLNAFKRHDRAGEFSHCFLGCHLIADFICTLAVLVFASTKCRAYYIL